MPDLDNEMTPAGETLAVLEEIIGGLAVELELLGQSPDNKNLRDRMTAVITAVRDLALVLAAERRATP